MPIMNGFESIVENEAFTYYAPFPSTFSMAMYYRCKNEIL